MFTWEPFRLFHHAEYNQIADTTYMIVAKNGYNIQYGVVDLKDYTIEEYKTMLMQSNIANQIQSENSDEQLRSLAFIAFITHSYKDNYFAAPSKINMDYQDAKFNLEHYANKVLGIDVWKEHVKEQRKEVDVIRAYIKECDKAIVKANEENKKSRWANKTTGQYSK